MRGPKLFSPSLEDWKAFFDVCESADIWNIGKDGRVISKDIVHTPLNTHKWSLNLEYPHRKFEIMGEERAVDIDVYPEYAKSIPDLYQDPWYIMIISDNIEIAMEYEKIQSVWDAFGKYIIKGQKFPLLTVIKEY